MPKTIEGLVVVYTAHGMLRAHVIKGKLESLDIPVLLQYESAGAVFPVTIDGLGEVQVLVPKKFEEQARQALNE